MFRIIKNGDFYKVEVRKAVTLFGFWKTYKWVDYEFEIGTSLGETVEFTMYHEALRSLLLDIEFRLNMQYLDNDESEF